MNVGTCVTQNPNKKENIILQNILSWLLPSSVNLHSPL